MKKLLLYILCLQICALNYSMDLQQPGNGIQAGADIIEIRLPDMRAQREPNVAVLLSPEILRALLKHHENWDLMPLVYATEKAIGIKNKNSTQRTCLRSKGRQGVCPFPSKL